MNKPVNFDSDGDGWVAMATDVLETRVHPWGGSLGLRISKKDADRLDLHAGDRVCVTLERDDQIDLPLLPTFQDVADASERTFELLHEDR